MSVILKPILNLFSVKVMLKSRSIIISLSVLNIALLCAVITLYFGFQESSDPGFSSLILSGNESQNNDDTEKFVFLQTLMSDSSIEHISSNDYWINPSAVIGRIASERLKNRQLIREKLVNRYGDKVREDKAFRKYFYPLGKSFSFLESKKQLLIDELRVVHKNIGYKVSPISQKPVNTPKQRENAFFDLIRKVLSPEEFFEYKLRDSSLARQLRAIDFVWTEREFRDVYLIRDQADESAYVGNFTGWSNANLYDVKVRDVLGDLRYMSYLKAQDPIYKGMSADLRLEVDALYGVYEQYVYYGELISQARINSSNFSKVKELESIRNKKIKDISGFDVASITKQPKVFLGGAAGLRK